MRSKDLLLTHALFLCHALAHLRREQEILRYDYYYYLSDLVADEIEKERQWSNETLRQQQK